MRSLQVTAGGALVQSCSIVLSVVVHEAMALLHVRGLLLWDGAQDGLPQAGERCWDVERDSGWDGERERRDRRNGELFREHDGRASEGGSGWRGEAWEEGGEDGSGGGVNGRHCERFQSAWWELRRFCKMKLFALNRVYFAAQSSSYERPIHLAALTDFWSPARHFSVAGTLVRMGCDRGPGGKGFGNSRPLGKFGACLTGYTLDPFHISR